MPLRSARCDRLRSRAPDLAWRPAPRVACLLLLAATTAWALPLHGSATPPARSTSAARTLSCPAISVLPSSLPAAAPGAAYSQAFSAAGGTAPYAFSVSAGALPPGLTEEQRNKIYVGNARALYRFA